MRVPDSQAYRKMDVTREHISRILELKEMLLTVQTGTLKISEGQGEGPWFQRK